MFQTDQTFYLRLQICCCRRVRRENSRNAIQCK